MPQPPTCNTCHAPLRDSPSGQFCPACLLSAVASADEALESSGDASLLPRRFGDYELLAEIGRGGMGLVFKARQLSFDRIVALKLLLTGRFSETAARRRFQLEAKSAARLQHPNIVAIHEVGEHDGHPFFTMDFVAGPNLAERCDSRPLTPGTAALYIRDIARGVHAAHSAGVLHRDLKPSNILLGADERPRITDFGLAKNDTSEADDLTIDGQVLGSPNYTSPEQAAGRNDRVGVASDVYGLGALLYHLLTGRAPFNAPSTTETLRLVLETQPASPRLLNPAVPLDLETICLKCLQKDARRRYASAAEIADEVERFLAGQTIRARPVSLAELGWRWGRRHPLVAALAAMVVFALSASSVVFYASGRRVDRALAREHAARVAAELDLYSTNMLALSLAISNTRAIDPRDFLARLDASRPQVGAPDLRGFEWRYFWTRSRSEAIASFPGHHHVVGAVSFSPNGTTLATHSADGVLKLWDAATRLEITTLKEVARAGGFNTDGTQFVFSRPDYSIWRFDIPTRQIVRLADGNARLIAALPNGRDVVVFGADQLPRVQSLNDSLTWPASADVPVDISTVVSADGKYAAVAGRPYPGILVLELGTGRICATLSDHRPVIGLALSSNGSQLVSAGFDGVLNVWDVPRGERTQSFKAFADPVWGLAFSADGRSFAAGGNNRVLKIWDTATWQETAAMIGHASTLRAVSFSPDGKWLATGGEDEQAMLWSTRSDRISLEMPQLLRGPGWIDPTPSLAFSPDGSLFAGTAADGTVKVWKTDTIATVDTFATDARAVAFSPDGKSILAEDNAGHVQRWQLGADQPHETFSPKFSFANWQIDVLSNQQRVAAVAAGAETRALCRLCEIPSARDGINHGAILTAPTIAMSPDGHTMFFGLPNGGVEAWDVPSQRLRFSFAAHKVSVSALATSLDGKLLATGSLDNSTRLWDAVTGQYIATFHAHNRPVWALAFSPDGKTLAAGSCDKEIILCSTTLLRHVASLPLYVGMPPNYEAEVRLLRFSPDGNLLAAALGDGTLRFFRAAPFAVTDAGIAHR